MVVIKYNHALLGGGRVEVVTFSVITTLVIVPIQQIEFPFSPRLESSWLIFLSFCKNEIELGVCANKHCFSLQSKERVSLLRREAKTQRREKQKAI